MVPFLIGLTGLAFLSAGPLLVVTASLNPYWLACIAGHFALAMAISIADPFRRPPFVAP
jgi:hypothetical protein